MIISQPAIDPHLRLMGAGAVSGEAGFNVSLFSNAWATYLLLVEGLLQDTAGTDVQMLLSPDGGSTWRASYDIVVEVNSVTGGWGQVNRAGWAVYRLLDNQGPFHNSEAITLAAMFHQPMNAARWTNVHCEMTGCLFAANRFGHARSSGQCNTLEAHDTFRLEVSAGLMDVDSWRLYAFD